MTGLTAREACCLAGCFFCGVPTLLRAIYQRVARYLTQSPDLISGSPFTVFGATG